MKVKNVFTKGILTDMDYAIRPPLYWDFPTQNIRVLNKSGQGLIISSMDGIDEEFTVTDGYIIVGATEYNGIIYLALKKEDDVNGEIGCYPSPKQWTANNTSFERVYKPLHCYFPGPLVGLNTPKFNFQNTFVDIIAKESYDRSVDLYITDFYNPIRVINSSFNQDGNLLERSITPAAFDGAINLIASSKKVMKPEVISVEDGGVLEPGVYYLFFRYLTDNFNGTQFIEELGPVCISDGNNAITTSGMQNKDWLTNIGNQSNKQIRLSLSNLDSAYKYVQIGVLFYSATIENAEASKNTYYISNNYTIDGNTVEILITGRESRGVLTFEQIITPRIPYNTNKTHVSINNVYYGGGWKRSIKAHTNDNLLAFAQKITVGYGLSEGEIMTSQFDSIWAYEKRYAQRGYFKNEEFFHKYTGYLHGEVYPFGIQFVFDDGVESDVFPVKGNIDGTINTKGLYRFPFWDETGAMTLKKTLGVKFDLNNAYSYFDANRDAFANVLYFRFVRGERIDNFIAQGVILPCWNGLAFQTQGTAGFGLGSNYSASQNLNMPLFRGNIPTAWYDENSSTYSYYASVGLRYNTSDPTHASIITGKKVGFFSSDVILGDKKDVPLNTFMKFAFYIKGSAYSFTDSYIQPAVLGLENADLNVNNNVGAYARPFNFMTGAADQDTSYEAESFIVDAFVNEGPSRFTSYLPGYQAYKDTSNIQEYNRSYRTLKYIGINLQKNIDCCTYANFAGGAPYNQYYDYLEVFNLYKTEPNSAYFLNIVSSFNPAVKTYQPISQLKPISSSGFITCFKGDCFLQKSFYRTHRWYKYDYACPNQAPGVTGEGSQYFANGNDVWYQSGFLLGMVTENLINADMRNEVDAYDDEGNKIIYSYFPRCLTNYDNAKDWVILRDIDAVLQEAIQVNDGFNKVLSGKNIIGYDPTIPSDSLDLRLNRIYNSSKHIPGSFIDGFRNIGLASFIDLPGNDGLLVKLVEFNDQLISVQENAINQHPIKERVTEEDQTAGSIVIASSVSMLPEFFAKKASFGSQHKSSIITTANGIYGVDWNNNAIWRIIGQVATTGNKFIDVENIIEKFLITSEWYNIKKYHSDYNDIISSLADDPLQKSGIVSGFNAAYGEIYFTFMFGRARPSHEPVTLGFNEKLNFFLGNYSHVPYFYISTKERLFSVRYSDKKTVLIHDVDDKPLIICGDPQEMKLSFIVNGLQEEQSAADFEKVFNALKLEMPKLELLQILYETESAYGTYTFLTKTSDPNNHFWLHSEYLENEWDVPVIMQTESKGKDYENDSNLRGHWLKITLVYKPGKGVYDPVYIKKVITDFTISKA